MAEFLVTMVVERVGEFLIKETKISFGVRDQVKQLQSGLREMQCFVKDANRSQDDSETLQNLIIEIREVALDAEDVLEVFTFKLTRRDRRRTAVLSVKDRIKLFLLEADWFFEKGIRYYIVGSKIQGVNFKIGKLTPRLQSFGIRAAVAEREGPSLIKERRKDLRRTYSHVIDNDFVGFEEDLKLVVSKLVEGYGDRRAVSICGMGGLGKTTLAKKVYHHRAIRSHFNRFSWVCVSQNWEKIDVLRSILINLSRDRTWIKSMTGDELVKQIYRVQQREKCLVVLDDIWTYDVWNTLQAAFPGGDTCNSRILLTTRKREVAFRVDRHAYSHTLGFLNREESLQLLTKKAAFGARERFIGIDMEKVEEILRRCGGLPIAIVALGGLICNIQTSNEWESVIRRIDMILNKGEGVAEESLTVQQLLSLSYDDLPYALKSCFMYFGNFLENYEVSTEKLLLLWVAEGMVSSEDKGEDETMLDVAERYLVELVRRSMIQFESCEKDWWVWGVSRREDTCRLHYLMRELCLSKRKKEGIKQSHVNGNGSSDPSIDLSKTRKLAVYFGMPVDLPDAVTFKYLRVLDFEGRDFDKDIELPKEIGNLIHLKFLSFRRCDIHNMSFWPASLGKLPYLQILDLRTDMHQSTSLRLIWKIIQNLGTLRHLYLPDNNMCNCSAVSGLNYLETLENVDLRGFDSNEFLRLTKLRKLTAEITMTNENQLEPFIDYLNNNSLMLRQSSLRISFVYESDTGENALRKLFICRRLQSLILVGRIKLPEYQNDSFSTSLTDLFLFLSEFKEDPMKTLEKLPNLQTLVFSGYACIGSSGIKMVCSSGGFPQLRRLGLRGMHNLEEWQLEIGTLPMLASLRIERCRKMKMLPEGLKFLTSLKELYIDNMPDAFKKAIQAEDSYKIQHVPLVQIV